MSCEVTPAENARSPFLERLVDAYINNDLRTRNDLKRSSGFWPVARNVLKSEVQESDTFDKSPLRLSSVNLFYTSSFYPVDGYSSHFLRQ